MILVSKKTGLRLIALVLIAVMSISLLGAAAPEPEAPTGETAVPETAAQTENTLPVEETAAPEGTTAPEETTAPEGTTAPQETTAPESTALAKKTASEPEEPRGEAWSWTYSDPELSDVLGREADTGLYILDLVRGEVSLEALSAVLPNGVEIRLTDGEARNLTVLDWQTDYPPEGPAQREEAQDFSFQPVFSATLPSLAEGLSFPRLTVRLAGAGEAGNLPEEFSYQSTVMDLKFYAFLDGERVLVAEDPDFVVYTLNDQPAHKYLWFSDADNPYSQLLGIPPKISSDMSLREYAYAGRDGDTLTAGETVKDGWFRSHYYAPVGSERSADVYYLQGNQQTYSAESLESLREAFSFYSVTVLDTNQEVLQKKYIFSQSSDQITLEGSPSQYEVLMVQDGQRIPAPIRGQASGTSQTVFTFRKPAQPYIIQRKAAPQPTVPVNFYVLQDNAVKLVERRQAPYHTFSGEEGRRFLPAAVLEEVYGENYGFRAEMLTAGTHYFAHSQDGGGLWMAESLDGYCPALNRDGAVDIYYLPRQTLTDSRRAHPVSEFLSGSAYDGFYTVEIRDPEQRVYDEAHPVPPVRAYVAGSSPTVSLGSPLDPEDSVTWLCQEKNGSPHNAVSGADSITVTRISAPCVLIPDQRPLKANEMRLHYHTNISSSWPPVNPEYETPRIKGQEQYVEITDQDHSVLPALPSYYYSYTSGGGKYLAKISFVSWQTDSGTTYLPGEVISVRENRGSTLNLMAQWKMEQASVENVEGSMVNFFVGLAPQQEGNPQWSISGLSQDYTESVYTTDCGVTVREFQQASGLSDATTLLGGMSGNLEALSQQVMQLQDGWDYIPPRGEPLHFQTDFPSDEEVLAHIRNLPQMTLEKITINNQQIPVEAFNTDNFTIKWNKFSSSGLGGGGDGWHIDGVLTAKTADLVVKKGFSGERSAIEAVKASDYQILVESTKKGSTVHDGAILTLDGRNGTLAPADYDPNTDEYTWFVPADPMWQYTIWEENYRYTSPDPAKTVLTNVWYMVSNSKVPEENTPKDWEDMPSSGKITVTAAGSDRQDQIYLTVELDNNYVMKDTLVMTKLDGVSKNPMGGVRFKVDYHSETETVDYGSLRTDNNGFIFLRDAKAGTYTFVEEVPRGYANPGPITVEVVERGGKPVIQSVTAQNTNQNQQLAYTDFTENSMEFTVLNYSKVFAPVTVHKLWGPNTGEKKVTLQLRSGGRPMGSEYITSLSGQGDNWQHTWTDLPVYIDLPVFLDQKAAKYSVRETAIGDAVYSPDYDSGFRYYDVDQPPMEYVLKDGTRTRELPEDDSQIVSIEIQITNTRRTGQPYIKKTDVNGYPLAGAEFSLYTIPPGDEASPAALHIREYTPSVQVRAHDSGRKNHLEDGAGQWLQPVAKAVSDSQGFVKFSGDLPIGDYYLIESGVPGGYENDSKLYVLQFDSVSVHLKEFTEGKWKLQGDNTVKNTPVYVNLIVTNRVEGNQADFQRYFDFTVDSDRVMIRNARGSVTRKTLFSFPLKSGESTENAFTLQVQSGASVDLSQNNGYDYSITSTVTILDDRGQVLEEHQRQGQNILEGPVPHLGNGFTIRVDVVNRLDGSPDTGLGLDSLPYLLLLGGTAAELLLLAMAAGIRRRRE